MNLINPEDYKFVWHLKNFNHLITSVWFEKVYSKYDFILIIDNGVWELYLGKSEKGILEVGKKLFDSFPKYQERVKDHLGKFIELKVQEIIKEDIKDKFVQFVEYTKKLSELYFVTEYFCLESVEKNFSNENIEELQELKFQMRKIVNKCFLNQKCLLTQFVKRFKTEIGEKDFGSAHYKEIISLLDNKDISIINRSVYGIIYSRKQEIFGRDAQKLRELLKPKITDEIKGTTACPGNVVGKVKNFSFDPDLDILEKTKEMGEGDVLVAVATGPEMVPAIKKASAIVTDEGGICSHAALISREFNIPCVMGTRLASQTFKDGDLIEVDANRGIVRKLK